MTVTIKWDAAPAKRAVRTGSARGVYRAAEHVLAETSKVVPIEESILSKSGTASVDEAGQVAAVSYDTVYAVRQHEELTWRHDRGRKAKYLESTVTSTRSDQARIIAQATGEELA